MAALTIARAYQHSFDTHPNSTLAITGGCLNAFGDFVAQISQKAVCCFCLFIAIKRPTSLCSCGKNNAENMSLTTFYVPFVSFALGSPLVRITSNIFLQATECLSCCRPVYGALELLLGIPFSSTLLKHQDQQGQFQGIV